jgi:UDP-glucose 4-epimerase
MKYLVTGCAGFIGSSLVSRLLRDGHFVIGVDNFSTGFHEYIDEFLLNDQFSLVEGDLLVPDLLVPYLKGVDAVFHLAANADIRGGLLSPNRDIEQNTLVTFRVLEAMRISDVKRIVFSSTAAALGEPEFFPTPENCAIPVQTSLYGASKMACEGLIAAYCGGFGFEGYVFRFVSVLGPRYPHGHVFDFVNFLQANPCILPILGNGEQRKSYLHINDCLDALILISESLRLASINHSRFEVYHLGVKDYCTVKQSAQWICDELGLKPLFKFSGGERGWVGDNQFVFLDTKKALSTGWKPMYGIEESVRETVRWLTSNLWIFNSK